MQQASVRVCDWLRSFLPLRASRKPARGNRLRLEALESRQLLTTTNHLAFAPPTTPVSGYTSVGLPAFDASQNTPYGWDSSVSSMSLVQHPAATPLESNFAQGQTNGMASTFEADLDPGTYKSPPTSATRPGPIPASNCRSIGSPWPPTSARPPDSSSHKPIP
jgi:hypothetical protein